MFAYFGDRVGVPLINHLGRNINLSDTFIVVKIIFCDICHAHGAVAFIDVIGKPVNHKVVGTGRQRRRHQHRHKQCPENLFVKSCYHIFIFFVAKQFERHKVSNNYFRTFSLERVPSLYVVTLMLTPCCSSVFSTPARL